MRALIAGILLLAAIRPALADEPLKVCLVSGAEEYRTDETLARFRDFLEANYPAQCTLLRARAIDDLPGLEALDEADVALFYTRRLTIDGEQLERVQRYARSDRPLVGVRTASHGFQNWLEFDRLVFGGNYHGHYEHDRETVVRPAPGAEGHPVLQGVGPITSLGGLYRVSPLADDVRVLLIGTAPEGTEPVAWVREHDGRRVAYTSLGAVADFDDPDFLRLLANALFWAAGREEAIQIHPEEPSR